MDCNEAKKLVIKAGHELVRSGLIARTWGNVSCRIDDESFVITPSGREYHSLAPDDIVEVKVNDLSYSGSIKPSSEKGIHAAAYRIHPEINFVIHTHQENASAISATELNYFRPSAQYSELGRTVVCAKYALPGTKALCSNVTDALEITSGHGMILKHHGTLCIGEAYEGAFLAAKQLEEASGIFINENGGGIQTETPVEALIENRPVTEEVQTILSAWNSSGNKGMILINTDFDVVRYANLSSCLKPLLDDFAQIVGIKIKNVGDDPEAIFSSMKSVSAVLVKGLGAVCWGRNEADAAAVSMIVRKNCKAYFASAAFGRPKYIRNWECMLMRMVYLKKYSKMSEKNTAGKKSDAE